MNRQQKQIERDHLIEQIEFYMDYIKKLETLAPDIIEENKQILANLRKRLQELRNA